MPTINEAAVLRFYVDIQGYSDRLTAIEAQAASSVATQKSEVATAIAQVNLTQSQTITALTLEVNNLKTNLTNSITATQTDLINRADQLAQDVTDITQQLTQDKATFTQEIQDALDYLKDDASVASALRTPRKIQGVGFDGTQDISLPTFTAETDGLVPKRVGATSTKYLREDGTWVVPSDTTYPALTQGVAETGTSTTANTISAKVLKDTILYHTAIVTNIAGNAGTATKLQTSRNINGVAFDGSADITLPLASTTVSGTVQLNNTLTSTDTGQALTAAQGKALNDSKLGKTENAVSASKLQTSRTISLSGGVTGSVSFDGSANASIAATVTGLGVANGIATLDSNGQVPSTQLPSYVDDILEYLNVAAFPTTGESGKIYMETTGNTTYRWSGSAYVKITSVEVASVAGKTGVVNLSKADVGLADVDNTADSSKSVASASKLTTARTIGGVSFDGTANINLPGVNTTGNQSTTGNAATASKLATPVQINGVNFDGSVGLDIPNFTATKSGVVPAAGSDSTKYLRSDGTWQVPTNTTYNVFGASPGLVPARVGSNTTRFLREDGTWVIPTNTQYTAMTAVIAIAGTSTTAQVISAVALKQAIQTHAPTGGGGMNFAAKIEIELETVFNFVSGDYHTSGNILSVSNQANIASAVIDSNGILCLTFNTPISNPNLIVTTKSEIKIVTFEGVDYRYLTSMQVGNFNGAMFGYFQYSIFQDAKKGYVNTNTKLYISCNLGLYSNSGDTYALSSSFPARFNLGIIDA